MSKILDLATTFQQKSEKELESIEQTAKNVIEQHKENLIAQLQDAEKATLASIQAEQAKFTQSVQETFASITVSTLRAYKIPLCGIFLLMPIMTCITAFLTWKAKETYRDMIEWQQSVEIAQKQTGKIRLSNCGKQSKPCVAIATETANENYQSEKDKKKGITYRILAE